MKQLTRRLQNVENRVPMPVLSFEGATVRELKLAEVLLAAAAILGVPQAAWMHAMRVSVPRIAAMCDRHTAALPPRDVRTYCPRREGGDQSRMTSYSPADIHHAREVLGFFKPDELKDILKHLQRRSRRKCQRNERWPTRAKLSLVLPQVVRTVR